MSHGRLAKTASLLARTAGWELPNSFAPYDQRYLGSYRVQAIRILHMIKGTVKISLKLMQFIYRVLTEGLGRSHDSPRLQEWYRKLPKETDTIREDMESSVRSRGQLLFISSLWNIRLCPSIYTFGNRIFWHLPDPISTIWCTWNKIIL